MLSFWGLPPPRTPAYIYLIPSYSTAWTLCPLFMIYGPFKMRGFITKRTDNSPISSWRFHARKQYMKNCHVIPDMEHVTLRYKSIQWDKLQTFPINKIPTSNMFGFFLYLHVRDTAWTEIHQTILYHKNHSRTFIGSQSSTLSVGQYIISYMVCSWPTIMVYSWSVIPYGTRGTKVSYRSVLLQLELHVTSLLSNWVKTWKRPFLAKRSCSCILSVRGSHT